MSATVSGPIEARPPAPATSAPPYAESAAVPIYIQLAALFRRRIDSGAWAVGERTPTLEALMAESGASRSTVRQAMGVLEGEGLLARHRGRGTFVLHRPERGLSHELETDWLSVVAAHEGVTTEILRLEPAARPPLPSHAGGHLAPAYQYMQRRHRRDGVLYLLGSAWLDARIWARLSEAAIRDLPIIRVLNDMPGVFIGRAEQTMVVTAADFEIARLLEVPLNAPVVVVDRSIFDETGTLLMESRGRYRADYVKLTVTLK